MWIAMNFLYRIAFAALLTFNLSYHQVQIYEKGLDYKESKKRGCVSGIYKAPSKASWLLKVLYRTCHTHIDTRVAGLPLVNLEQ